ncbi:phage portal protein [Lentzea sp. NPDC102401]|uniref:phage portal protein n=1 Tax=Lentzea sp. NPDC102401 TaxID=3364128 RepID=UPI0038224B67
MGWLRTLLGLPGPAVFERAAETPASPSVTFSLDITPVDDLVQLASATLSNSPVSRKAALSVPAVLRGRNILCAISTLPLVTRDRDNQVVVSPLVDQIDPNVANIVVLAQTVEDLVFDAISWWKVTARNAVGWPTAAMHCDVHTVSMEPPGEKWREARTLPSGQQLPGGSVWVNGVETPARDMIRFDSPNPPLREAAARTIRRAVLLEQVQAMYARDPRPQDYFTPAEGADQADDDEIREILDAWQQARRERSTGYVPNSLTYNSVDSPSPAEMQLVELEKQVTIGLANAMGIDPEDLGVSTTSRTYQNGVDRRQDRINDTLASYMGAVTSRLSMNDITPRGRKVFFELDEYLRADPLTRWQTYKIGTEIEAISVPEIRSKERYPAVPVEPSAANRARPSKSQEVAGMPGARTEATAPVAVKFSNPLIRPEQATEDDTSAVVSFSLSAADAQFTVDRETRTVSGLLVPWNKVARSGWSKWSFKPNSLKWADASRVKLNREHDRRTAVAYASDLKNTAPGLWGSFKVARGAAGDEVLSLAEDKVLDGFSIEVDFDGDGSEWTRDPDDDLVKVVTSGQLRGCAITSAPAFDDARVTSVAASRNERNTDMPGSTGTEQETPAAAPVLGPEAVAAFTAAVEAFTANAGGISDAITALVEAQQKQGRGEGGEGPEFVDPRQGKAQFEVNEKPLYRFDGRRGEHDFSSDMISGLKGDEEAKDRVQNWLKDHFARARAEFAVTTGNISSLNPAINRPDLYVDQLTYRTPIWDAIRKGTLDDATPFVLPKFNTSSGLVAAHTQNTEPTPGALTTTAQTITPSAVSGKIEITREAWDQGGNPQLSSIVWRQMLRAWDEALEIASATLLAGLTVTTLTLTAGLADKALAKAVKASLAGLHFVRGGFRFQDFELEQGLYTALTNAQDDTGRSLFPIIGAQNADGLTGNLFGSLNVGGLAGRPAWALPYTAGAANKSFLFNREDVHGWATTPRRLDFEYQVKTVEIGIWGYQALACTRTDGVRAYSYDETA